VRMSSRKAIALAAYESVKLPIYYRPVKVKLKTPTSVEGANGTSLPSEPVFKTYDSFQIAFYEGGRWRTARAPTLTKAKAKGREIAKRLAENGARLVDLSQEERRVYVAAKNILQPYNLEIDTAARLVADQDIAGAQEKSAGSVETRIYCGQVAECHCASLTVAAKSSGIAPTPRASSGPPGACTTPPSSLPSTWSAVPDVCASGSQDCLWIIKPTVKIVPASKLKAPHRTCAVATSAALLLQMVAAPRPTCRQISPHQAAANFAGNEP